MMEPVGKIRNQLAHFRKRLDAIDQDTLEQVRSWLATRPDLNPSYAVQIHPTDTQVASARSSKEMYAGLRDWLKSQLVKEKKLSEIRVTFQDIETLLPEALPSTAHEHESWWSNDDLNLIWLEAGWRVKDVNLAAEEVTFQRSNIEY